jgi:molecular chaperone HscB
VDHFARFGLPRRYALDRKALDAAYQRLSFAHHPDLLAGAEAEHKRAAEQAAAELNEAYRVLASDSERAVYLLGLLNNGAALHAEALPPGFLQAMFLLQEEVEDLDPADTARRKEMREEVEQRMAQVLAARAELFARAEQGATRDVLQEIQINLNEERYLRRLLERL